MTRGAKRVLEFLRDRRFHTLAEIEHECQVEGRSRLSELRAAGYVLERHRNPGGHGKSSFSHRLVQTVVERGLQDEESSLAEPVEGMPASSAGSASDEEGRSVVDGVGVEGSAAAATTPAPERTDDGSHQDASQQGPLSAIDGGGPRITALDSGERGSAAASQTLAAAAPAVDLVEALPPPSPDGQLQLEEAS